MNRAAARRSSPLAWPLIAMVRLYQRWISPGLPPHCRFYPSCSAYAVEALQLRGLLVGTTLSMWRLLRCAPWHPGGVDPVPPRRPRSAGRSTESRATEERAAC